MVKNWYQEWQKGKEWWNELMLRDPQDVSFVDCQFNDDSKISFEGYHFPGSLVFVRCEFIAPTLSFGDVVFSKDRSERFQMDNCVITAEQVSFRNVTFSMSAFEIKLCTFSSELVDFSHSNFNNNTAKIYQCTFVNSEINFFSSKLNVNTCIEFNNNTLGKSLDFSNSKIKTPYFHIQQNTLPITSFKLDNIEIVANDFLLKDNISNGILCFNNSNYTGELSIQSCHFNSTMEVLNTHLNGNLYCNNNTFEKSVILEFNDNTHVENLSLSRSIFNSSLTLSGNFDEVPDLRNTYIKSHISLSKAVIFPKFKSKFSIGPIRIFKQAKNDDDHAKIRRIKEILESNKNHQRALDLHIMELQTRRWQNGNNFLEHWPEYVFSIVSNYGKSASRPAIWYLTLQALSTLYIYLTSICTHLSSTEKFLSSMVLSISYSISFLSQSKDAMSREQSLLFDVLPTGIKLLSIFNGVASSILFFLIVLALRNRFRI